MLAQYPDFRLTVSFLFLFLFSTMSINNNDKERKMKSKAVVCVIAFLFRKQSLLRRSFCRTVSCSRWVRGFSRANTQSQTSFWRTIGQTARILSHSAVHLPYHNLTIQAHKTAIRNDEGKTAFGRNTTFSVDSLLSAVVQVTTLILLLFRVGLPIRYSI